MKKILKDAFALFCITLVAGVALAGVYAVTKDPIAKAEMEARASAYRVIFTDAAEFATDDKLDETLKNINTLVSQSGIAGATVSDALYAKDAAGNVTGYVMTVGGKGYGGTIQVAMGITADWKVTGISILSHSETAGLGSKCEDESFYGQFANQPAAPFEAVKNPSGETSSHVEIQAISGATVTSKGVTDAVNVGIWFAQTYMQGGGAK